MKITAARSPEATRRTLLDNGWFVVSLLALFAAAMFGVLVVSALIDYVPPPAIEAEAARDYPIRSGDSGPP